MKRKRQDTVYMNNFEIFIGVHVNIFQRIIDLCVWTFSQFLFIMLEHNYVEINLMLLSCLTQSFKFLKCLSLYIISIEVVDMLF